jgi:Zn-dependent protease with chaperone function
MDFFEHQQQARRHTALMVLMFVAAVVAIVLAINVVGGFIFLYATDHPFFPPGRALAAVPRMAYVVTTGVVLAAIAWGSISRMMDLSSGGAAVAELLGAQRIKRDSQQPLERRLLNIVEEMALASGISVPQVYVMDEARSINAFAAGYSPNEAAVTVTRGTMEQLSRDELQGVIGHEFSHILNGDMRLNIRLMGVIAGIVIIGAFGEFVMRVGSGKNSDKNEGNLPMLFGGLVIWLIGLIGVFAGRVIKAAISREREFLADASSVQFTRNPEGIAGALFKIGQGTSLISVQHAEEVSHMCIGAATVDFFEFDIMLTHPPIGERIDRLLGPGARLLLRARAKRAEAQAVPAGDSPVVAEFLSPLFAPAAAGAAPGQAPAFGRGAAESVRTTQAALIASVGSPSTAHVEYARRILEQLPAELRAAAGNAEGGRAVLAALLLGEDDVRSRQIEMIRSQAGDAVAAQAASFAGLLRPLGPRARMPLLDLAMPSLKRMDEGARDALQRLVKDLAEADGRVTVGEFVLLTLCRRHLGPEPKGAPPVKYRSVDAVATELGVVLSLLAHSGGSGMSAFDKGMAALGIKGGVLRSPAELGIAAVEGALYELKLLAPLKKPLVIKACLEVVMADGKLTVAEGELMRAIGAALDTPLPPILETVEAVA